MIRKLSVSLAALAAMGIAGAASAQETVTINVDVQAIAELETTQAAATMIIDDSRDGYMSNPSSVDTEAPGNPSDFDNVAAVALSTNYPIDAVRFSWDQSGGTGPTVVNEYDDYWGAAVGGNGNTLAVLPQGGILDGENGTIVGGGGGTVLGQGEIDLAGPFGNGVHHFGIGVSTNWGNTISGEPEFAEPDVYSLDFDATIVPSL